MPLPTGQAKIHDTDTQASPWATVQVGMVTGSPALLNRLSVGYTTNNRYEQIWNVFRVWNYPNMPTVSKITDFLLTCSGTCSWQL